MSRGWNVSRAQAIATRAAVPLVLLLAWLVSSTASRITASVLPPPQDVVAALAREVASGDLLVYIAASLGRAAGGFVPAALVGITLGFAMGVSTPLRGLLSGPVELLRPISSIAWIPLSILWFGLGFRSVVFIIFVSCVFIILLNTMAAARDTDRELVKAARVLGAGRREVFLKVVVPRAMPRVLLGLRIATAGAWGGVIIAEMISSETGLGYMIGRAQATFQPALVIGGMVVIGLVGYAINALFRVLERRLPGAA